MHIIFYFHGLDIFIMLQFSQGSGWTKQPYLLMSAFGVDKAVVMTIHKASITVCFVVWLINVVIFNYTDYCKGKRIFVFLATSFVYSVPRIADNSIWINDFSGRRTAWYVWFFKLSNTQYVLVLILWNKFMVYCTLYTLISCQIIYQ